MTETELPDLGHIPFEEMETFRPASMATVVPCENYSVLGTFATELTSECLDLAPWPQELLSRWVSRQPGKIYYLIKITIVWIFEL
jgi:hypothetical protein